MKPRLPIRPASNRRSPLAVTNAQIAELLALAAPEASHFLAKALRKASRLAWMWPEEAAALHAEGRSLTEFPGIGPHLEKVIRAWIENPPPVASIPDLRKKLLDHGHCQASSRQEAFVVQTIQR